MAKKKTTKNAKKTVKPAKKPAVKSASKKPKAKARPAAAKPKKAAAKAAKPAAAKNAPQAKKAVKSPKPAPVIKEDKKTLKKEAKGKKVNKKSAANQDDFDLEDDLLVEEGDFPEEDIPDLDEEIDEDDEEIVEAANEEKFSEVSASDAASSDDQEVVLTDAEGRKYCRARDCDQISMVEAYCRYHYLLYWKRIQVRKKILADGKLVHYVEELTSRYPDKFLEMIRKDLRTDKDFLGAIQELEIDESSLDSEFEDESQSFIEEVRGMGGESETASDDDY